MTTLAPPPAVTSYANAVRDHLTGLDAETLDELTGGLEADLAEALSERMPDGGVSADLADVTSVFGSPELYADELRSAAGVDLPEIGGKQRASVRGAIRGLGADARASWAAQCERHAWLRWASDLLVSLRPVWWVARGWMLFWLIVQPGYAQPLGRGLFQHLLLIGAIVLSVLWGQGRLGQRRWLRRLGLLVSVVTALALPIVLNLVGHQLGGASGSVSTDSYWEGYNAGVAESAAGVSGAGVTATNLFVYGPDGLPIENAQIVDQDGNPLVLADPQGGMSWATWDGWSWMGDAVPVAALEGSALNVYPWSYVDADDLTQGPDGAYVGSADDGQDPQWPAAALFPVVTDAADEVDVDATVADDPTAVTDQSTGEETARAGDGTASDVDGESENASEQVVGGDDAAGDAGS